MIGLVDGNNFFVSCERVFDPKLEGKPVAVLSNNDGCCISRSNEFKALGIAMGTPYFKLRPFIDSYGLILKSSNYELYADLSRRVISTLLEFTPEVEQYSIDEAFVHITLPAGSDYGELGRRIRGTILQWVGIPCGVGFAASKTLAKIANHIGKKRPDGVFVMPENARPVLETLPVSEVWGIGRHLGPKLVRWGLRTAWQLAEADEAWLRRKFNILLAKTARELRGETALETEPDGELSRSISCSRSFGAPVTELSDLSESICTYTAKAAEKLRKEGQYAAGVNVYFQYYPEYSPVPLPGGITSTTIAFPTPMAATGGMLAEIRPKLPGIFLPGRRYKKSGVVFFGLESAASRTSDIFSDPEQTEKAEKLSGTMDQINAKFGKNTLFHLSEGISKPWRMKRDLLTPSYTTRWDQLPEVK